MARAPTRPPVEADVADIRERMARMEGLQQTLLETIKEHALERRESTLLIEAERKAEAVKVESDRRIEAAKVEASLLKVDERIGKVETDLRDYRVGGKVLMAVGAAGISISAAVGAIVMKAGIVLGYIKPT